MPFEFLIFPEASHLSEPGQLVRGSARTWHSQGQPLLLLLSHAASWAPARHFLEPNCRALPTFFLNYIFNLGPIIPACQDHFYLLSYNH